MGEVEKECQLQKSTSSYTQAVSHASQLDQEKREVLKSAENMINHTSDLITRVDNFSSDPALLKNRYEMII